MIRLIWPYSILNDNDQNELNETRNLTIQFLEAQSQASFKLLQINTNIMPATILTFQEYGSTDNTQNIIDINSIKDVSFVEGDVTILAQ